MLRAALDEIGVDYFEAEGEAAFYGPKLDIQVKTALGNEETLSTIQLDFRFRLSLHDPQDTHKYFDNDET